MAKLQRFIETTSGPRGPIGEHATYEWQTIAEVDTHKEAQEKAQLLDPTFGYRLDYGNSSAILVSIGQYRL